MYTHSGHISAKRVFEVFTLLVEFATLIFWKLDWRRRFWILRLEGNSWSLWLLNMSGCAKVHFWSEHQPRGYLSFAYLGLALRTCAALQAGCWSRYYARIESFAFCSEAAHSWMRLATSALKISHLKPPKWNPIPVSSTSISCVAISSSRNQREQSWGTTFLPTAEFAFFFFSYEQMAHQKISRRIADIAACKFDA